MAVRKHAFVTSNHKELATGQMTLFGTQAEAGSSKPKRILPVRKVAAAQLVSLMKPSQKDLGKCKATKLKEEPRAKKVKVIEIVDSDEDEGNGGSDGDEDMNDREMDEIAKQGNLVSGEFCI